MDLANINQWLKADGAKLADPQIAMAFSVFMDAVVAQVRSEVCSSLPRPGALVCARTTGPLRTGNRGRPLKLAAGDKLFVLPCDEPGMIRVARRKNASVGTRMSIAQFHAHFSFQMELALPH